MLLRRVVTAVAVLALCTFSLRAQGPKPRPLAAADLDALASLLKIEDTRQFDEPALVRLLQSPHPAHRGPAEYRGHAPVPRAGARPALAVAPPRSPPPSRPDDRPGDQSAWQRAP